MPPDNMTSVMPNANTLITAVWFAMLMKFP